MLMIIFSCCCTNITNVKKNNIQCCYRKVKITMIKNEPIYTMILHYYKTVAGGKKMKLDDQYRTLVQKYINLYKLFTTT